MSYRNWQKKLSLFVPGSLRPIRSKVHVLHGMSWGVNADGSLAWIDPWTKNILHDGGEQYMLSAVFATGYSNYGAALPNLYLGLDNRTTPVEGDTLASLTGEPTGLGGYTRKTISTAGTGAGGQPFVLSQPGAYYIATSATQTWTAAGAGYGTVRNRFLASDISAVTDGDDDHLLASLQLSTPRTINDGDTLNTNLAIGLSE